MTSGGARLSARATSITDLLIARDANPQVRDASGATALDAVKRMSAHDTPLQLTKARS